MSRSIVINNGAGPLAKGTSKNAVANMEVFAADLEKKYNIQVLWTKAKPYKENGGRYPFELRVVNKDTVYNIEMPGWTLLETRYMQLKSQDIWDFPRWYVNGNSGVWWHVLGNFFDE